MLIFRRWKIALPLLLLAIGATAYIGATAKPDYTMTSYVQLIPAKVAATDNPASASLRNPWNQLGLNTLGQAAIYRTQDQGFLQQLKATHHTDNFTLTMTYPNPIVTVEVVGKTQVDARDTTELILNRLRAAAESLQRGSGVGDADIIATQRLDQGQNLVPSTSKVKRAILAVAAAGLVMTAGGTVGLDAILRRRARRRAELEDGQPVDTPPASEPASATVGGRRKPAGAEVPAARVEPTFNGAGGRKPAGAEVPAVPAEPTFNGGVASGLPRGAVPESVERTAIIIKRTSSVVKAEPPKQRRSPAATYRSSNAQSVNGDGEAEEHESTPGGANGDSSANASDVRSVLQPNWVGGENGGQSK